MAKTLLVLGNGFDLKVGLKSSFRQYLDSTYNEPMTELIREIYQIVKTELYKNNESDSDQVPQRVYDLFGKITFWDLYYTIPHISGSHNNDRWYDFEGKLQIFLSNIENSESPSIRDIKSTNLKEARDRIKRGEKEENTVSDLILKLYLDHYGRRRYSFGADYFETLLNDLKEYEIRFGKYIESQQVELSSYNRKAESLIRELLAKDDELVYINTFNYSDLQKIKPEKCAIWHVNGDTKHPIFGIDNSGSTSANSKWFSFTKTYRRLELEGNNLYYPQNKEFAKVVVFGHSLNRQDYSYFYALFNQLNLSNDRGRRNGYTVEFAYSGHPGKTPKEARRDTIGNVLKLLQGYNKDVLHEENFRLMDILYCNGAIKFKEIPENISRIRELGEKSIE